MWSVIENSNLKTHPLVQLSIKTMEMRYQTALITEYSNPRRKKTATSAVSLNVVGDRWSEKATALCLSKSLRSSQCKKVFKSSRNEKTRLTRRAKRVIQMWSVIDGAKKRQLCV